MVAAAVAAVLSALALPGAATAQVPAGFFGVVPQGPVSEADLDRMEGTVETLRVPVEWFAVEARRGVADFAALDRLLGATAERGIRVLPVVSGTPAWLRPSPALPPLGATGLRAYAGFLRALVRRYGAGGRFWDGRAVRLPVRAWQVWNEPNFPAFWRPKPSPWGYAKLLRVAAAAIRGADPKARVVLAGVAPIVGSMKPWTFLRRLYAVPGVSRWFDVAAVHPYSVTLRGTVAQIILARRAMVAAGDARTPLVVGELAVASRGSEPTSFVRGEAEQAAYLAAAFDLLTRGRGRWRLAGLYWYGWQDSDRADAFCAFCEGSGLMRLDGTAKPAWAAYRAAVARAR